MSIASRNGKLHIAGEDDGTRWRRREDLLTADVFGAYRYLPVQLGLGRLLAGAVDADGRTLAGWATQHGVDWAVLSVAWYAFWPRLGRREPDLVVVLGESAEAAKLAILVEVKLHADQHEIEGRSQIGHYGATFLGDEFEDPRIGVALPLLRPVVLITKSPKSETAALHTARRELGDGEPHLRADAFWTNWTAAIEHAEDALDDRRRAGAPAHELAVLEDLVADLAERGFHRPRVLAHFPLFLPSALGAFVPPLWGSSGTRARSTRAFHDLRGAGLPEIDAALRCWRLR